MQLFHSSVYGNLQGPNSILCPVDFEAASDIHLLQISAKAFHNIIFDFPNIRQKLVRLCPEREVGRFDSLHDFKKKCT